MKLAHLLTRDHGLTDDQLAGLPTAVVAEQRIDNAAIAAGLVSEADWLATLGRELSLDCVDIQHAEVDAELLKQFPTKAVFRHGILPLHRENGHVVVAISDPLETDGLDELSALSGLALTPVLAPKREITDRIKSLLGVGGDTIGELVRLQDDDDEAAFLEQIDAELAESAQAPSVIRLVNELLVEAVEQKASDVHIEPSETGLTIRFRVDGLLRVQPMPPEIHQFGSAIVTRLKIMARLNIAEKRLPQDGRIAVRVSGREIDVRASIIPMVVGEGIVLRLLDKSAMDFNLQAVGMPDNLLQRFSKLIARPHGIILVTGPTGSGKSTTLYSALNQIKSPTTKIITVEDPVEYHSSGVSQIQVQPKVGLTFAAGLRSILRHDPDVILIGEIRDGETAESAIQASLTGHLVFSSLHTNDAPSAITRLVDMGVEPYLVASTVDGILAQRLVRRLCATCKTVHELTHDDTPPNFDQGEATIYKAVGCRDCQQTGYRGRTGIFELLVTDKRTRQLTSDRVGADVIREHAIASGMETLRQSGFRAVREGQTSLEEVLRVTQGDLS